MEPGPRCTACGRPTPCLIPTCPNPFSSKSAPANTPSLVLPKSIITPATTPACPTLLFPPATTAFTRITPAPTTFWLKIYSPPTRTVGTSHPPCNGAWSLPKHWPVSTPTIGGRNAWPLSAKKYRGCRKSAGTSPTTGRACSPSSMPWAIPSALNGGKYYQTSLLTTPPPC